MVERTQFRAQAGTVAAAVAVELVEFWASAGRANAAKTMARLEASMAGGWGRVKSERGEMWMEGRREAEAARKTGSRIDGRSLRGTLERLGGLGCLSRRPIPAPVAGCVEVKGGEISITARELWYASPCNESFEKPRDRPASTA